MRIFTRGVLEKAFPDNPRLRAQFEQLDGLLNDVDENGRTLTDRLQSIADSVNSQDYQPKHPLLDSISDLPNKVGSIEVTEGGAAKIRPIDGEDPASLVSRGAGHTVWVGIGGVGPTSDRPVLPLGYVALYFDTTIDPDGQPVMLTPDGRWLNMHGDPA